MSGRESVCERAHGGMRGIDTHNGRRVCCFEACVCLHAENMHATCVCMHACIVMRLHSDDTKHVDHAEQLFHAAASQPVAPVPLVSTLCAAQK